LNFEQIKIKLSACETLHHLLHATNKNFENTFECSIIMEFILKSIESDNNLICSAGYSNLIEVVILYYDKLAPFMQRICKVSLLHSF
jgi:hypothetical protein